MIAFENIYFEHTRLAMSGFTGHWSMSEFDTHIFSCFLFWQWQCHSQLQLLLLFISNFLFSLLRRNLAARTCTVKGLQRGWASCISINMTRFKLPHHSSKILKPFQTIFFCIRVHVVTNTKINIEKSYKTLVSEHVSWTPT